MEKYKSSLFSPLLTPEYAPGSGQFCKLLPQELIRHGERQDFSHFSRCRAELGRER